MQKELQKFYKGKKVLITGHTGFKGSWLCKSLVYLGADVYGYALEPPTDPALFKLCGLEQEITSYIGDIRSLESLQKVFEEVEPEIVIHMAAQPIVRESYDNPVYTYETNVMGTVNILECVRMTTSVKSFLNVTTDKVYKNKEWEWGYREHEELNGYDPYSNSKSCSELITDSYVKSFFADRKLPVSTARAGNVIGGGDFAADRIIPDCVRAAVDEKNIIVRNPYSTRPYQHVLEPLYVYLMIAMKQSANYGLSGSYNVGPDEVDCVETGTLVTMFCDKWNTAQDTHMSWENRYDGGPHEANFLKLDCSKLKHVFGWKPKYHMEEVMDFIVEWYGAYVKEEDVAQVMEKQVQRFFQ